MHEAHLMSDLIHKVESIAKEQKTIKVKVLKVWLGAHSHFTKEHFQEHFDDASRGTIAEGAQLEITLSEDWEHPDSLHVLLQSVEIET